MWWCLIISYSALRADRWRVSHPAELNDSRMLTSIIAGNSPCSMRLHHIAIYLIHMHHHCFRGPRAADPPSPVCDTTPFWSILVTPARRVDRGDAGELLVVIYGIGRGASLFGLASHATTCSVAVLQADEQQRYSVTMWLTWTSRSTGRLILWICSHLIHVERVHQPGETSDVHSHYRFPVRRGLQQPDHYCMLNTLVLKTS